MIFLNSAIWTASRIKTKAGLMLGSKTHKRHARATSEGEVFSEANFIPLKRLRLDEAPGTPTPPLPTLLSNSLEKDIQFGGSAAPLPFAIICSAPIETNTEVDPDVKISYPDIIEFPGAPEQHADSDIEDGGAAFTFGRQGHRRTSYVDDDGNGSDGRMSNQSIRAQVLRRRVGGSDVRLVLPESMNIPSIPSVVLSAGPDTMMNSFGPLTPVDDSLALVPYVPRERILFPSRTWNGAQDTSHKSLFEIDDTAEDLNAMDDGGEPPYDEVLPLLTPVDGLETMDDAYTPMEMEVEGQ